MTGYEKIIKFMKKLTATYRIVTPMFVGDAEQKATSIRPPSVKVNSLSLFIPNPCSYFKKT